MTASIPNARSGSGALGPLTSGRDQEPPTRGGMPEAVADRLREAILDGVLAPGAWLREAELAKELEVSRTPIRDAFRILVAEGLVDIRANQGAVVSAVTSDDILELYTIREALEGLAARLAARRGTSQCLVAFGKLIPEMRRIGADGEVRELSRLNFEFHDVVRVAAGNRYLDRSLARIQNAVRRFPDPTLKLPGRIEESIDEHVALADAITRGDPAEAERLAVEHIRHLSELRIRMLLHH
jgi:DNA-binding GntR family transcriptional regulator